METVYALRYLSETKLRVKFIRVRHKPVFRRVVVSAEQQRRANLNRIKRNEKTKLNKEIIPFKGRGICASDWFSKGDFILRYSGELISRAEGLRRDRTLEKKKSKDSFLYFFSYNTTRLCVDATKKDGTWGRLVNHSRLRPNCRMSALLFEGKPALVLVACRDIVPGEEIVYDYGEIRRKQLRECDWIENS